MVGGNLFLFDSFGAFGSDSVFRFNEFDDAEKAVISSYEESLDGQFFQYSQDCNYKNGFTFSNNRINTLILHKSLLNKYTFLDNMSTPLYYLLDFLKQLCPGKSSHSMFYYSSQLQPLNTIVCGELCILVAESLF